MAGSTVSNLNQIRTTLHQLRDWQIERQFEIFPRHRSRYAPDVTHNREHWFGLTVPTPMPVTLAPAEHLRYEWLPWREAAERTISATNREAILMLPDMLSRTDL